MIYNLFNLVDSTGAVHFHGSIQYVLTAKRLMLANIDEVSERDEVAHGEILSKLLDKTWYGLLKVVVAIPDHEQDYATFTQWLQWTHKNQRLLKTKLSL